MSRSFIIVGDKTSHGGQVISGDNSFLVHGKAVARVGDLTVCPRCKGTFPIISGADDMTSLGQPPARDGDKTACGATLIASQAFSTHAQQQATGPDPAAPTASAADIGSREMTSGNSIAPAESGICLSCMINAAKTGASMIVRE